MASSQAFFVGMHLVMTAASIPSARNHVASSLTPPSRNNRERRPHVHSRVLRSPSHGRAARFALRPPQSAPPLAAPTINPEPQAKFKLHGNACDVLKATRPPEMAVNAENLAAGKRLYYRNCMYCHGDYLNGKGHFADALNPLPANFRDGGTISQLEEGYVYWRIATGAPGLPQGATPWNSSMPVWQDFLSENEIWQVIAYIYDASGSTPRTWEGH